MIYFDYYDSQTNFTNFKDGNYSAEQASLRMISVDPTEITPGQPTFRTWWNFYYNYYNNVYGTNETRYSDAQLDTHQQWGNLAQKSSSETDFTNILRVHSQQNNDSYLTYSDLLYTSPLKYLLAYYAEGMVGYAYSDTPGHKYNELEYSFGLGLEGDNGVVKRLRLTPYIISETRADVYYNGRVAGIDGGSGIITSSVNYTSNVGANTSLRNNGFTYNLAEDIIGKFTYMTRRIQFDMGFDAGYDVDGFPATFSAAATLLGSERVNLRLAYDAQTVYPFPSDPQYSSVSAKDWSIRHHYSAYALYMPDYSLKLDVTANYYLDMPVESSGAAIQKTTYVIAGLHWNPSMKLQVQSSLSYTGSDTMPSELDVQSDASYHISNESTLTLTQTIRKVENNAGLFADTAIIYDWKYRRFTLSASYTNMMDFGNVMQHEFALKVRRTFGMTFAR